MMYSMPTALLILNAIIPEWTSRQGVDARKADGKETAEQGPATRLMLHATNETPELMPARSCTLIHWERRLHQFRQSGKVNGFDRMRKARFRFDT